MSVVCLGESDLPGARCVQGAGGDVGGDKAQSLGLHGEQRADERDQGKQAPPTTSRVLHHRCLSNSSALF